MINQFGYEDEVPSGVIIIWPDPQITIPAGWLLCDGSNGTPNFDGRYVKGTDGFFGVGDTGGSEFVTMSINQMPRHKHSAWTHYSGNHKHNITARSMEETDQSWGSNYGARTRLSAPDDASINSVGDHVHTLATETSVGTGAPIDIKPLTKRVNYIIKA